MTKKNSTPKTITIDIQSPDDQVGKTLLTAAIVELIQVAVPGKEIVVHNQGRDLEKAMAFQKEQPLLNHIKAERIVINDMNAKPKRTKVQYTVEETFTFKS